MRVRGSRVAIVGAGPGGLAAAKYAIEAGFDVTVFEAGDELGGQWHTAAGHSGVWPGMHTNTSRAMTAFSDFPVPADHPLHPAAEQVHAYLDAYARAFGVTDRIRFRSPVETVAAGWQVNGEPFDFVALASGRFRSASSMGRPATTTRSSLPRATSLPSPTLIATSGARSAPALSSTTGRCIQIFRGWV
jgi:dimethylaniline monooxygenase (N-oxide forming)